MIPDTDKAYIAGLFDGEGKFSWANGETFEGKFENNLRIEGTYTHLNGDKFVGKYKNDQIYYGTYYSFFCKNK